MNINLYILYGLIFIYIDASNRLIYWCIIHIYIYILAMYARHNFWSCWKAHWLINWDDYVLGRFPRMFWFRLFKETKLIIYNAFLSRFWFGWTVALLIVRSVGIRSGECGWWMAGRLKRTTSPGNHDCTAEILYRIETKAENSYTKSQVYQTVYLKSSLCLTHLYTKNLSSAYSISR